MSINGMMTLPVVIVRAGSSADRYGNEKIDWSRPVSTQTVGWLSINQVRMEEDGKSRDGAGLDGTAFLPSTADVRSDDRLIIDGMTYQVFGIPAPIYRPGFGVHHVECRVKRHEG